MSDDQEKIKGRKGKKAPNNRSEGETDTKSSVSESGHASSKQDEPQEISTSNGEDDSQGSPASNEEDDPEGSSASDGEDGSEETIFFGCKKCSNEYSIYEDREHRKIAQDGGENVLLGDVGKFCGAFYHVDGLESSFCLDANTCAIGIRRNHQANPLTAVALVKYEQWEQESSEWAIKSVRRYTNCFGKKMHAENFFYWDIKKAKKGGEAGFLDLWNKKKWRITMYLTMQPCHLSTDTGGTKRTQSCCKIMKKAKKKLGKNVTIVIKPTHLCKVGWHSRDRYVKNAEEGVRMLFKTKGIELERMKKGDWEYLLQYVQLEVDDELPNYDTSERKKQDEEIGKKLRSQQQLAQKQLAQKQLAQKQLAQKQLAQKQLAQEQLAPEQLAQELVKLSVNEKRRK